MIRVDSFVCVFIVFITAGPSTKLFAWWGGNIGGHVLQLYERLVVVVFLSFFGVCTTV